MRPGHLRDAFCGYLDGDADAETVLVDIGYWERRKPVRWLVGQLWNCTDVLPSGYSAAVDLPSGSTYAQAVRKLAAET